MEALKELIDQFNVFRRYRNLKNDWMEQNELIDIQKADLVKKEHDIHELKSKILNRDKLIDGLTVDKNKLKAEISNLNEEIRKLETKVQEREELRRKVAGKVGGLTSSNNRLRKEKLELTKIIEDLEKENRRLKFSKKPHTIAELKSYHYTGKRMRNIEVGRVINNGS